MTCKEMKRTASMQCFSYFAAQREIMRDFSSDIFIIYFVLAWIMEKTKYVN